MKKRIRLLAALLVSVLLLGGCGTPMYELTEDEETLITQYAAYAVGKHNIRQTDGMTSDKPKQEEATTDKPKSTQESSDTADTQTTSSDSASVDDDTASYPSISLTDALGCSKALKISYKGYKLEESYKEGNYFSVNADAGNTLLVMKFTIANTGKKTLHYDTESTSRPFYGVFDGRNRVAEKMTFSNKELSSSSRKLKAGKKMGAVMIFELSKEQAAAITTEDLLVDVDGTTYRVDL